MKNKICEFGNFYIQKIMKKMKNVLFTLLICNVPKLNFRKSVVKA